MTVPSPFPSNTESTAAPAGGTRITRLFERLRAENGRALIAFVTAGDPDLETTRKLVLALGRAGADLVELGIPFSDPLLDGPVIQAASQRALDHGTRVAAIFDTVEAIRRESQVPIIFMTCMNPIHRVGAASFARRAAAAGIDGILVTDLPPEEAHGWIPIARSAGLDRIFMLAPTSSDDRIASVAAAASGFIYCQSRAGVTGFRQSVPPELGALMARVRSVSPLPIGVGFGISTPEHARSIAALAEGVVVGTAFVRLIEEHGADPAAAVEAVANLAARLKAAAVND